MINLQVSNTQREDILSSLRLRLPKLRPSSKAYIEDLIEVVDIAGEDDVTTDKIKLLLVALPDNHKAFNKYQNTKVLNDLKEYDYVREWGDGYKLCCFGQYIRMAIINDTLTIEEQEQLDLMGK